MDERAKAEQLASWRDRLRIKERILARTGDCYLQDILRGDIHYLRKRITEVEASDGDNAK